MAKLNVDYLAIDSTSRSYLKYTFDGIAAMTAWARVEAGMHFPSDVLSGWALGHFMAHMAKGFIIPDQRQIQLYSRPLSDGLRFQLVARF